MQADFIELGPAEDLDGEKVSVSVLVKPESKFVLYNEQSQNIDLQVEALFELALAKGKGSLVYEISATVTD